MSTDAHATAEDAERDMEEASALLRAACNSFFEIKPKRAA
jgi:hypothetical protein